MSTLPDVMLLSSEREKLATYEQLAWDLIDKYLCPKRHGDWVFKWDSRIHSLGGTTYLAAGGIIALSYKWTLGTPAEEVEDTIRHEIAHALVGPDHGHNDIWKGAAIAVGAKPQATYDGEVSSSDISMHKWEMVFTPTNKVVKKYHRHPGRKFEESLKRKYLNSDPEKRLGTLIIRKVNPMELIDL